jgi:hypothetical protein
MWDASGVASPERHADLQIEPPGADTVALHTTRCHLRRHTVIPAAPERILAKWQALLQKGEFLGYRQWNGYIRPKQRGFFLHALQKRDIHPGPSCAITERVLMYEVEKTMVG